MFIGLENINPESLMGTKKRQNKIWEYREMLQAWRKAKVMTYAGYILGFPTDTPESIARDIEIIKKELPIDILEFFYLTPLPGSEDHKKLHMKRGPDGPRHEQIRSRARLHRASADVEGDLGAGLSRRLAALLHRRACRDDHAPRASSPASTAPRSSTALIMFSGAARIEGVHPLQFGFVRRKVRTQRRYGMPIVNPLIFYPWRAFDFARDGLRLGSGCAALPRDPEARDQADPNGSDYTDEALTPDRRPTPVNDQFRARCSPTRSRKTHGAPEASRGRRG